MDRATAPVVGVALLVAVTVAAGATVGAATLGFEPQRPADTLALSATADAASNRITLGHEGGDSIDVHELSLSIRVEDTALAEQPPVPYFAAEGFVGAPTGPFNQAADPRWSAGERASLAIASTNAPTLSPGDRVTVTVATNRTVLAQVETLAE
jgi:flagellin-like protein